MSNLFAGDRVKLRAIEPKDISKLHEWFNNPETRPNVYISHDIPKFIPFSLKKLEKVYEEWQKDEEVRLVIEHTSDSCPIGFVHFDAGWDAHCPGIDLFICKPYRRQGYGRETLALLLNFLFNYTMAHVTQIWINEYVLDALEFFKAMGFKKYGEMRYAGIKDGKPYNTIVLGILKREWMSMEVK